MNSTVETLTSRKLDWSWGVTKLKAIFETLFVKVFCCQLKKKNKFKIFIGFFRIYRFPFSIAMEAPPHVHAEVPLKIIGFRCGWCSTRQIVFAYILKYFYVGLSNSNFSCDLIYLEIGTSQKPAKFSFSEKPWIRVPLPELRTVPHHYVWFGLEGTPPIKLTLMNTSTTLKNIRFNIKGFQIKRTGTYKYTLLAENNEGNDSKTFEVTVLGKDSMLLNFIQCR